MLSIPRNKTTQSGAWVEEQTLLSNSTSLFFPDAPRAEGLHLREGGRNGLKRYL